MNIIRSSRIWDCRRERHRKAFIIRAQMPYRGRPGPRADPGNSARTDTAFGILYHSTTYGSADVSRLRCSPAHSNLKHASVEVGRGRHIGAQSRYSRHKCLEQTSSASYRVQRALTTIKSKARPLVALCMSALAATESSQSGWQRLGADAREQTDGGDGDQDESNSRADNEEELAGGGA